MSPQETFDRLSLVIHDLQIAPPETMRGCFDHAENAKRVFERSNETARINIKRNIIYAQALSSFRGNETLAICTASLVFREVFTPAFFFDAHKQYYDVLHADVHLSRRYNRVLLAAHELKKKDDEHDEVATELDWEEWIESL